MLGAVMFLKSWLRADESRLYICVKNVKMNETIRVNDGFAGKCGRGIKTVASFRTEEKSRSEK